MDVTHSIQQIVDEIYQTDFASKNVDVDIRVMGALNYVAGAKLRLTLVDTFNDTDVAEWKAIARRHGATRVKTQVRTSRGEIDLNIEYKGRAAAKKGRWLFRSAMIAVAAMSYLQLHQLQEERYPLPNAWFA
tara:strand:+ start:347 stop:742 length:396 start_codon:yes stop_codon:yes gene_type:complete